MRYWVEVAGQEWIVDHPDPSGGALPDGACTVLARPDRAHLIAQS